MSCPLLDSANERLAMLPIKFPDVWRMYKQHEASIWHAHEIKLDKDIPDWKTLDTDEQYFLKHVLAFFASSDLLVSENIIANFMKEITMTEAVVFYGFQNMMENIHSEVYAKIIDAYIDNEAEKSKLFNAVQTIPCVSKKASWCKKWLSSANPLHERLVAWCIVEGVFFSGSFCAIYWMGEKGKLLGLLKANEFIARDEGLHTDFGCLLYNKYAGERLSDERFAIIMKEAVEYEIEFLTQALPVRLIGMNHKLMTKYIKLVADRLALQLKHKKIYNIKDQPFPFMDKIAMKEKSNFFEEDVATYKKFNIDHQEQSMDFFDDL